MLDLTCTFNVTQVYPQMTVITVIHRYKFHFLVNLGYYINCAACEQIAATSRLLTCVSDIDRWMSSNRLKLNAGKTEFTWLGTRQQLAKLNMSPLQIKDQVVTLLDKVRDLGVIIDSKLTMESHTA